MPEATMHENDLPTTGEHEIWRTRQFAAMQAKAPAHGVHHTTHD
jgi:hypothetical protein